MRVIDNPFEMDAPKHLYIGENLHELDSPFAPNEFFRVHHQHDTAGCICVFATHWHDRMEFLRIREGLLSLYMNEPSEYTLTPGMVAIICPNQAHRGINGTNGATYDVLALDLDPFLVSFPGIPPLIQSLSDGRILWIMSVQIRILSMLYVNALGHSYVNGICERCGKKKQSTIGDLIGKLFGWW